MRPAVAATALFATLALALPTAPAPRSDVALPTVSDVLDVSGASAGGDDQAQHIKRRLCIWFFGMHCSK